MSAHELRHYQYVNQPYRRVRDALLRDPLGIFQRGTVAATGRARAIGATLRAKVGAVEVAAEVDIQVRSTADADSATGEPVTRFALAWQAKHHPEMFPTMEAVLAIYPLSRDETQLDLQGMYRPPLSVMGTAFDALIGHRLAEASVHRFVEDIAERLRQELSSA